MIYNSLSPYTHSVLAAWCILGEKWPHSFVLCSTSFANESPPRGKPRDPRSSPPLLRQWLMFTSRVQSFWHNLQRAKRIKDFFFLIAKHNALCQQTMKGLSWQTVRSVSFSWSRGLLAYGTDGTVSRGVGCDVERAAPLWGGGGRRYSLELICMGLSAVPEPSCLAARWFRWPRRLYQNSIKMIHSLSFVPVLPAVFSGALKCRGL